jgi:hypothetical protein
MSGHLCYIWKRVLCPLNTRDACCALLTCLFMFLFVLCCLLLGSGPDKDAYFHQCFLRGKGFLWQRIGRVKIKNTGARKPSSPNTEPNFYDMHYLLDVVCHKEQQGVPPPQRGTPLDRSTTVAASLPEGSVECSQNNVAGGRRSGLFANDGVYNPTTRMPTTTASTQESRQKANMLPYDTASASWSNLAYHLASHPRVPPTPTAASPGATTMLHASLAILPPPPPSSHANVFSLERSLTDAGTGRQPQSRSSNGPHECLRTAGLHPSPRARSTTRSKFSGHVAPLRRILREVLEVTGVSRALSLL